MYAPFENNVKMLAGTASMDHGTFEQVVKGARRTRNKIDELFELQFPNELLEHVIWFERCRPSERALKVRANIRCYYA